MHYLIVVSFFHRFQIVNYGASTIFIRVLFLCIFLPSYRNNQCEGIKSQRLYVLNLLKIFTCSVYFFTGLHKILSPDWFPGGEALYFALVQNSSSRFFYLFREPLINGLLHSLSQIISPLIAFAELFFPFLIFNPQTRRLMIIVFCIMHFVTFILLDVTLFSPLMFLLLFLFIEEKDVDLLNRQQEVSN